MQTEIADMMTPKEALPLFQGRLSLQSLHRLMQRGIIGPDGNRLKLPSIKLAGRRYLTEEGIKEFIAASNADPSQKSASGSSIAAAVSRGAAADAALKALGY